MNVGGIAIPWELVRLVIALVAIIAFSLTAAGLVLIYVERKVAGFVQRRPGPYEVGPFGTLQLLADAAKMIGKELHTPVRGDRLLFWAAPVLALAPIPLLFLPIPFSEKLVGYDTELGVVLVLAFTGVNVLSVCLAGYSSYNKWALLGAVRAVSQAVAYEIPLLITVLSVVLMSGTMKLSVLAGLQGTWPWQWNWAIQPLGFCIFFVCMLAETNRAPFDLPEAESELTAGFHTEYSGLGFGLFFVSEYASMIAGSAVCATLFLGGWHGPLLPGWIWLLIKIFALLLVMMWVRWTFPRVRFDQLLNISWRWLIPFSLLNLLLTAFLVKL